jgi:hypothetical protein
LPVVQEEKKIEVVSTAPPVISKPIQKKPYPNAKDVKKKKFRPKRPRIIVTKESKPIPSKDDSETPKTEIAPEKID